MPNKRTKTRRRRTRFIAAIANAATFDDLESSRQSLRSAKLTAAASAAFPALKISPTASAGQVLRDASFYLVNMKPSLGVLKSLFKALQIGVPLAYPNFNSQKKLIQAIRKIVDSVYGRTSAASAAARAEMFVDQAEAKKRSIQYDKKVAAKNNARKPLDADKVRDTIDAASNSADTADHIIAAMLSSGARRIEVLATSTFSRVKSAPSSIKQSNLSKRVPPPPTEDMTEAEYATMIRRHAKELGAITKPLIHLSATKFKALIKKIRATLPKGLTAAQLSSKYDRPVNAAVAKYFNGNTTAHSLRKMYATLAYATAPKTVSEQAYIARVLGHKTQSTAKVYNTYYIDDEAKHKSPPTQPIEETSPADPLAGVSRNERKRDGLVLKRLAKSIAELEAANIKPTVRVLHQLRYGSSTVARYRRGER